MEQRGTYPPRSSQIQRSGSHSQAQITFSLIWVLIVAGATAVAWLFLVFVAIGTSVGTNDGANRVPRLLLNWLPVASALLIGGGLWFIHWLCRPKPPNRSEQSPS
jgi:hypothetical protein